MEQMKPGRELDARIAREVFKMTVSLGDIPGRLEKDFYTGQLMPIPRYSNSIADAWEVVEKLSKRGEWTLFGQEGIGWEAKFYSSTGGMDAVVTRVSALENTAPLAICLAALKALESK